MQIGPNLAEVGEARSRGMEQLAQTTSTLVEPTAIPDGLTFLYLNQFNLNKTPHHH